MKKIANITMTRMIPITIPFVVRGKLDTKNKNLEGRSLVTVNGLQSMNDTPYKEGQSVFDFMTGIVRYDSKGTFHYSMPRGKGYDVISATGDIRKFKDNEKLYDIPLKKGNVIIGKNFYSIDRSSISREIIIEIDL